MKIDDDRVAGEPERAGGELLLDAREGIIERVHEDAAHHVDDEHPAAAGHRDQIGAAARRARREIGGADQPGLALDIDQRLALIEGVIAESYRIGAGFEELLANRLGDAKAAGGVFAVDGDEVEPPSGAQKRKLGQKHGAARPPDHVADEQQPHRLSRPCNR